jgi:hypothetical protein
MNGLSHADEEFVSLLVKSSASVAEFQFSDSVRARFWELVDRKKLGSLSPEEAVELERYNYLEHLVRMAKIRVMQSRAQAA